jgi:type IV pilus assembly protein PilQ
MQQDNRIVNQMSRPVITLKGVHLAAALAAVAGASVALGQQSGNGQPSMQGTLRLTEQPVRQQAGAVPQHTPGATIHGGRAVGGAAQEKVYIDDNSIVDLHVSDEDLGAVLEMLSIQSQRNIVASKNVSARVTANLYGVTFFEALDAILNVNGYGYIEDGNFIFVYTLDEIVAIEKANKQRVSKAISMNYLSAIDAAEFVKPLLSEGGQIKTNGKVAGFPSMSDVPVGNEEYALASTIVIYDYEENVAEIEMLIRQIDTRPAQVLIEATILQTSLNEANAFGVDFAIVANMNFGDFVNVGGPLVGPNALLGGKNNGDVLPADRGGTAIGSNVGNTSGPGGLKVGVVSNDVAVFLRVLDEVTDATVLSNPKVLTLNRQAARVLVGRRVGYLSTTSTDTATTQTVEFLNTGTQLYVRPFVTPDGMIRMELKPQVSEAVIRDVKDASGAAVTIPDEITNELTTNVMVRDGQTIVLGGLFRESTVSTRRQIPFLGDIPIIGSAFRGNEDQTERSEIIFLITPTIVNDQSLTDAGRRGLDFVDRARAGAREGVLRWSRDRMTGRLNVEAERLAAEGNNEKAMWKVERSLRLNATQVEAMELRERLGGPAARSPGRSMLEHIIHGEATGGNRRSAAPAQGVRFSQVAPGSMVPAWIDTPSGSGFVQPETPGLDTPQNAMTTNNTEFAQHSGYGQAPVAQTIPQIGDKPTQQPADNFEFPLATVPTTAGEIVANALATEAQPPFQAGFSQTGQTTTEYGRLWLGTDGFFGAFWSGRSAGTLLPQVTGVSGETMDPADHR